MSPQDRVERVLKEIHITFTQCPTYNGEPDRIIVDRKQFLQLLDRLNNGIFDMMEKYEQTRQSRLNAERAFKKKGDEIIEQASSSADDIYAASVLYTADAIGRIRELMDQTNESMNDLFIRFRKELREQKDVLKSHESELHAQLIDLSDTKKYLSVLQDINKERARSARDHQSSKEAGEAAPQKPAAVLPRAEAPAQEAAPAMSAETDGAEKPQVIVNQNAAYFKWKAAQEADHSQAEEAADPDAAEAAGEPEQIPDTQGQIAGEPEVNTDMQKEETEAPEQETAAEDIPSEEPDIRVSELPDEESIRQAVLADERAQEAEEMEARGRETQGRGHILKNLIFGKDE